MSSCGLPYLRKLWKRNLFNSDVFCSLGSVALLSHFHKVLALSKFTLLKCEIEVNPVARIPQATSTAQFQFE